MIWWGAALPWGHVSHSDTAGRFTLPVKQRGGGRWIAPFFMGKCQHDGAPWTILTAGQGVFNVMQIARCCQLCHAIVRARKADENFER